eukprot:tig00001073_g6826.t1
MNGQERKARGRGGEEDGNESESDGDVERWRGRSESRASRSSSRSGSGSGSPSSRSSGSSRSSSRSSRSSSSRSRSPSPAASASDREDGEVQDLRPDTEEDAASAERAAIIVQEAGPAHAAFHPRASLRGEQVAALRAGGGPATAHVVRRRPGGSPARRRTTRPGPARRGRRLLDRRAVATASCGGAPASPPAPRRAVRFAEGELLGPHSALFEAGGATADAAAAGAGAPRFVVPESLRAAVVAGGALPAFLQGSTVVRKKGRAAPPPLERLRRLPFRIPDRSDFDLRAERYFRAKSEHAERARLGILNQERIPLPYFKRLKRNVYVEREERCWKRDEVPVCDCVYIQGVSECHDESCINRMLNVECTLGYCRVGEHCRNTQIQQRRWAKTDVFLTTDGRGFGLRVTDYVPAGDLVIEFVGEVIPDEAAATRLLEYSRESMKAFYFALEGNEVIDATIKGNNARFINHSCKPTCVAQPWRVNGETRLAVFALEDMQPGVEVSIEYNFDRVPPGERRERCLCGAPNCRLWLGARPSAETPAPQRPASAAAALLGQLGAGAEGARKPLGSSLWKIKERLVKATQRTADAVMDVNPSNAGYREGARQRGLFLARTAIRGHRALLAGLQAVVDEAAPSVGRLFMPEASVRMPFVLDAPRPPPAPGASRDGRREQREKEEERRARRRERERERDRRRSAERREALEKNRRPSSSSSSKGADREARERQRRSEKDRERHRHRHGKEEKRRASPSLGLVAWSDEGGSDYEDAAARERDNERRARRRERRRQRDAERRERRANRAARPPTPAPSSRRPRLPCPRRRTSARSPSRRGGPLATPSSSALPPAGGQQQCHACLGRLGPGSQEAQRAASSVLCSTPGCGRRFCGRCLQAKHGISLRKVERADWTCPACVGVCRCAACRPRPPPRRPAPPRNPQGPAPAPPLPLPPRPAPAASSSAPRRLRPRGGRKPDPGPRAHPSPCLRLSRRRSIGSRARPASCARLGAAAAAPRPEGPRPLAPPPAPRAAPKPAAKKPPPSPGSPPTPAPAARRPSTSGGRAPRPSVADKQLQLGRPGAPSAVRLPPFPAILLKGAPICFSTIFSPAAFRKALGLPARPSTTSASASTPAPALSGSGGGAPAMANGSAPVNGVVGGGGRGKRKARGGGGAEEAAGEEDDVAVAACSLLLSAAADARGGPGEAPDAPAALSDAGSAAAGTAQGQGEAPLTPPKKRAARLATAAEAAAGGGQKRRREGEEEGEGEVSDGGPAPSLAEASTSSGDTAEGAQPPPTRRARTEAPLPGASEEPAPTVAPPAGELGGAPRDELGLTASERRQLEVRL